jgi:hypothetical protein
MGVLQIVNVIRYSDWLLWKVCARVMHLLNAERHPDQTLGLPHALTIPADWVWYNQDTTPQRRLFSSSRCEMHLICLHRAVSRSSLVEPPLLVLAMNINQASEPNFILESDPCLQDFMLRKGMTFGMRMTLFRLEGQND